MEFSKREGETVWADAETAYKNARAAYANTRASCGGGMLGLFVCLRGGKCFCFEVFAGNLFVTVRACKHFVNFAGEISKTL